MMEWAICEVSILCMQKTKRKCAFFAMLQMLVILNNESCVVVFHFVLHFSYLRAAVQRNINLHDQSYTFNDVMCNNE